MHRRHRRAEGGAARPARRRHAEAQVGRRRGRGNRVRDGLHAAQTPQGFPYWPILAAHEKAHQLPAGLDFTDDAAIAEWAGICRSRSSPARRTTSNSPGHGISPWPTSGCPATARAFPTSAPATAMTCTPSSPATTSRCAASPFRMTRSCPAIPMPMSALHALTDALLATCGAGDIGTHFPPSDPQWKGAASRIFVEHAAKLVRERGGRIANADVTLICEAPRVGPHREAMTAALSRDAGDCRRPHLDQGDNQRKARLRRPRGRHRGDRHRQRGLSRRGARMSDDRRRSPTRLLQACRAPRHHAGDGRILHRRHDRRRAHRHCRLLRRGRPRLRHLFQRSQDGDARRLRRNARRAWRGVARDGAGDGGRRARAFARRHRAVRSPALPARAAARPTSRSAWSGSALP